MKIKLMQVCAYANWLTESFEIWRLYPIAVPRKKISREMRSLFLWIFSEVVDDKGMEDLSAATFVIGGTDDEIELNFSEAEEVKNKIYYGWYLGKCLDLQRLQYFKPEKIIKSGFVKLTRDNKAEFYETSSAKLQKSPPEIGKVLQLRRILGDDPKRIEVDKYRFKLGLPADFLFSWKEKYEFKNK